jgi:hypothetical protein
MKENSSCSIPCETAAVRIQYWFGKDKRNLLLIRQLSSKTQDFSKKHKCDFIKIPRTPSQVEHLPLQGYLSKKKRHSKQRQVTKENFSKTLRIAIDPSHCTICQKNLNNLKSKYTLSSARVVYCRLKEQFLVFKRLKNMTKQGYASPKRHNVVSIKSSNEQDLFQNPYLQEWAKIKEERQFQVRAF